MHGEYILFWPTLTFHNPCFFLQHAKLQVTQKIKKLCPPPVTLINARIHIWSHIDPHTVTHRSRLHSHATHTYLLARTHTHKHTHTYTHTNTHKHTQTHTHTHTCTQLALKRDVAKLWRSIEYENSRRARCLAEEVSKAETERSQPRSKRQHVPRPWESQGSEVCVCVCVCVCV
jgi:hypothetical protein